MKGLLTIVMSGMLAITACAFGSRADLSTSERQVSEFTGLDVGNGILTNVVFGDSCAATVTAPDDVIENIVTEVKNGTLFIYWKHKVDIKWLDRVEVNVTAVSINRINASSGARVISDTVNADILTLAASSGAQIDAMAKAGSVVGRASSGSVIRIVGDAQKSDFSASSGSQIKADKLLAGNASAKATSGAGITLNVSEKLDAEANSGGRVRYSGSPANTFVTANSGGSVSRQKE